MSTYNPTYRERTNAFRNLRSGFNNSRSTNIVNSADRSDSNESDKSLLPRHHDKRLKIRHINTDNTDHDVTNINIPMIVSITPIWLQYVELIDDNLHKIELQIGELKEYQSLRQRIIFDDEKANQYDINIQQITHSVTSLLKSSKIKLQQIGMKANESGSHLMAMGFEERTARYNAMKSRAMKLQQFTKIFHHLQREFIKNMKIKQAKVHKYIDIESVTNALPDLSNVYNGYTQEQIAVINEMEHESENRTKAIAEICRSIHELAQLFQELSVLIVEQGSLLDRIDYNVEQTLETLQATRPIVQDINKHQKRSRSVLCIIVLIMLIILMALLLLLKNSV